MNTPSPNGSNGRGAGGQFAVGNAGGPGNPHGRRVAQLRAVLLDAVTDDDVQAIVAKLVERAKGGDLRATKAVLDRPPGKPPPHTPAPVPAPDTARALPEAPNKTPLAHGYRPALPALFVTNRAQPVQLESETLR